MSLSKKLTFKGTLRQVFICLCRTPYPPTELIEIISFYYRKLLVSLTSVSRQFLHVESIELFTEG
jgi:hypothetical protein